MATPTETPSAGPSVSEKVNADELYDFLMDTTKPHLRGAAMEICLGLTGGAEKDQFFRENLHLLSAIVNLSQDKKYWPLARDAYVALVNLSTDEMFATRMIDLEVIPDVLQSIIDPKSEYPDEPCMLLCNLSRSESVALTIAQSKMEGVPVIHRLVDILCRADKYNPKGKFRHLAFVLFNLTQVPEGRRIMLARTGEGCVFQRLITFTQHQDAYVRGGVVGLIKNCCHDTNEHEWLLSDEVGILPYLVLPLAGPEEFDEEEMEGMPDDLQYLPPDKTREPDADIRKMLLQSLFQLCATKKGRVFLREKKIYPILRELHKWEPEEDVKEICTDVVHVLIGEEDPRFDNLKEVEIPEDVKKKLEEIEEAIRTGDVPEIEYVHSN